MKTTWAALLLLGSSVAVTLGEIDFTPILGYRTLEGVKFSQLLFHQNGQNITYEQPRGWSYSGDASRIRFNPPDVAQAIAEIAQVPLAKPETFDDETTTRL